MQHGEWSIELVETGRFRLDGGAMFGVVPKTLWSKAYDPGNERNTIPMAARGLLIDTGERRVLVDTGNGDLFDDKSKKIYEIDNADYTTEGSLVLLGYKPEDITDVVLTHLHFDHAGGAVRRDGADLVPAFANARYYVQRKHWEWAHAPTPKDRASFIMDTFEPLMHHGVLDFVDGDEEILPGIRTRCVHGHTPFLQMVEAESAGRTLLFAADLLPTSAHVRVAYGMAYDNNPLVTIEEKSALLPAVAEARSLVIFGHDAKVQAGLLANGPRGVEFGEPVEVTSYARS